LYQEGIYSPSSICTLVKSDETGKIVGFCITKRNTHGTVPPVQLQAPENIHGAENLVQGHDNALSNEEKPASEPQQTIRAEGAEEPGSAGDTESLNEIESVEEPKPNEQAEGTSPTNLDDEVEAEKVMMSASEQSPITEVETTGEPGLDEGPGTVKDAASTKEAKLTDTPHCDDKEEEQSVPDCMVAEIYTAIHEKRKDIDKFSGFGEFRCYWMVWRP